jgi:hypothetical protein
MLVSIVFGAVVFIAAQGTVGAQNQAKASSVNPAQGSSVSPAPDSSVNPAPDSSVNPDEIIRKFAARELEFRKARENYTYTQILKMEELDSAGQPEGKWEETTDVTFGPNKQRMEHVTYAPVISLQHISLDPQDEQDLRSVQPFVLTSEDIGKYDVEYLGKQKVDEIPCYQFSVKPKKMVKNERYFQGTIWVDDRDFQIVKTYGKGVGIIGKDHAFPNFETYREQIDGKYWFPTYTHADDVLHFGGGRNEPEMSQRIRMVVRYTNYKRFGSDTTITYGDTVPDKK